MTGKPQSSNGASEVQRSSLSASQSPTSLTPPTSGPLLGRTSLPPPTLKLEIGHSSQAGNRYAGVNQDYVAVQEMYAAGELPRNGQQTYIITIADGHGILGDKSASFAGKALTRHIYSGPLRNKVLSKLSSDEVVKEMKAAFKKAHNAANAIYDTPPRTVTYPSASGSKKLANYTLCDGQGGAKVYRSAANEKMLECGCTCTAAVIQGTCLCIADVGDSQAVLGSDEGTGFKGQVVTMRHHCLNPEELERIKTQHSGTTRALEDGYIQVFEGPWAGYELSVTRALGHKNMEAYGVSDDPYVTMIQLDEEKHRCLVIASDGVWDVMTPDEVVRFVMDYHMEGKTAAVAAEALVNHVIQLGYATEEGEQDNTSAIVVFFRPYGTSQRMILSASQI